MKAISLAYHDVVEQPLAHPDIRPGIALYTLTQQCFQEHLHAIGKRHAPVDVIRTFHEWSKQAPTFLTFDDGASNACCAADELEKRGWRGHFFVVTNWIGRPKFLDRQQIRELRQRNHVIGSHSCSHPARLSHLPWNRMCREWSESCSALSDILGEPVKVASVPNGYFSHSVAQAAAAAGIQVLFTSEASTAVHVIDGCLVLGRYLIRRHTPPEVAGALAAGDLYPRWKQTFFWKLKKALKMLMGESYLAARRAVLSKSALNFNSAADK